MTMLSAFLIILEAFRDDHHLNSPDYERTLTKLVCDARNLYYEGNTDAYINKLSDIRSLILRGE